MKRSAIYNQCTKQSIEKLQRHIKKSRYQLIMAIFLIITSLASEDLITDRFYPQYYYVITCCIDGISPYCLKLMTTVTLIPMYMQLLLRRFLSFWEKLLQLVGSTVHASLPKACKNLTVKVNLLCFVILAVPFLLILERDKSICNKPFSHTFKGSNSV